MSDYPDIIRPQPSTVAKYGMSLDDFEVMLDEQGGVCGVCGKVPKTGRLVIDHVHRQGYKLLSPDLLSIKTDPRIGKQTFTVTDLDQGDPDPALFQLPAGFEVVDRRQTGPPQ